MGPLNPPAGPITSTHKTLTEVEPRIPISSTTTPGDTTSLYRITQPGSYYLTGNITGEVGKHGISIAAENVTLDLNGFTLLGQNGTLSGIYMSAFRYNVVIRNGHIRGWGGSGIETRIDSGRIEGIVATGNGGWGINNAASVSLTTYITGCEALSNSVGGIRGANMSLISGCFTRTNDGFGIYVGDASIVTGCTSRLDVGGIRTGSDCIIRGNLVQQTRNSAGHGIHVVGVGNRIEDNHVAICQGTGIRTETSGNVIIRNTARSNATNYHFVGSQIAGPIITGVSPITDSVSPWANFAW
jgi:hypothetical protein